MLFFIPADASQIILIGNQIKSDIHINSSLIYTNSDSLILNGKLLIRDIDYKFESYKQSFSLNENIINEIRNSPVEDSLIVQYKEVPAWLTKTFGLPLPELTPLFRDNNEPISILSDLKPYGKNNIIISGVKTFRVESHTNGNATFNQSLDLNISGNIDKRTIITGSISDRGYS
ncbi:MAG: hypothetical protein U9N54_08440, partial [candidate division Zixibacteria bacterium]|nr:hypothetical protein [candidate division Zixibacteria bacterium]